MMFPFQVRDFAIPLSMLGLALFSDVMHGPNVGSGPVHLHAPNGEDIYIDFAQVLAIHPSANAEAGSNGQTYRLTAIWTMGDPEPLEVQESFSQLSQMVPNYARFVMPASWVNAMGDPIELLLNGVHVVSIRSSNLREVGKRSPSAMIRVAGGKEFLVDANPRQASARLGG